MYGRAFHNFGARVSGIQFRYFWERRAMWNFKCEMVGQTALTPNKCFTFLCPEKFVNRNLRESTTSIEAVESQTQQNNCFSVETKFKLFFRQTSLHQNVKHLVGTYLNPDRPFPNLLSITIRRLTAPHDWNFIDQLIFMYGTTLLTVKRYV